jgi:hypothetical protein
MTMVEMDTLLPARPGDRGDPPARAVDRLFSSMLSADCRNRAEARRAFLRAFTGRSTFLAHQGERDSRR